MKHVKDYLSFYKINESSQELEILSLLPPVIDVSEFTKRIGFSENEGERYTELWTQERPNFRIHYFPFKTQFPILGVFFFGEDVCINSKAFWASTYKSIHSLTRIKTRRSIFRRNIRATIFSNSCGWK